MTDQRPRREPGMGCKSCGAVNRRTFTAEIAIHCPGPGLKDIDMPAVWVFPDLAVCLECGIAEFAVPEAELRLLAKGEADAG